MRLQERLLHVILGLVFLHGVNADFTIIKPKYNWTYANQLCTDRNQTLIRMSQSTEYALIDFFNDEKINENFTEFSFWTNHMSSEFYEGTTFGAFPVRIDQTSPKGDQFCVYAIYEVFHSKFGWRMTYCNSPDELFRTVCMDNTIATVQEVTLFAGTYKTNQINAERICAEREEELLEIPDESRRKEMVLFLRMEPWVSANVTMFWTKHKTSTAREITFTDPFPGPDYVFVGGILLTPLCVKAIYDVASNQLGWKTDDCVNTQIAFMCKKETENCYYTLVKEMKYDNPVILEMTPTDVIECQLECTSMVERGFLCGGFNFIRPDKCFLVQIETNGEISSYPDPNVDFYRSTCTIKPFLLDGIGENLHDWTTKDTLTSSEQIFGRGGYYVQQIQNYTDTGQAGACNCYCQYTNKTLEERIKDIINDIQVDKKQTSFFRRKLYSAPDSRISSRGMGLTAGVVLASFVMAIIAMDNDRLGVNLHFFWRKMHRVFRF